MLASQINFFPVGNVMVESHILVHKINPWFLKVSQGHLCPRDFNVPWILLRNKCYLHPPPRYWNCLSPPKAQSWLFFTPYEVLTSQDKLRQYDHCRDQIMLAALHRYAVVVNSFKFFKFLFKLMIFVIMLKFQTNSLLIHYEKTKTTCFCF